ncbi:MAG: PAS domain S-box protein [Leptospiraceae bacterium]|nr:PAS domain S-box protein [Leptospiraceae bacterium]
MDSLQEGIWAINKEGFTTFTNENFEKMLGFTKEEMKNKHILDFIEDSKKEFIKENIKRRQEGIKEELEFEFIKKTGEKIITLVATAPILDENYNYDGAIAGIIDITDRKINELKIANLLTSKEIILKEVHHRIKNNMSNIIGILNIERSRIDNPKIDSILMDIESRIMNMMKLYETLYISDDYQNVSTEKFFNSLIDQIIDNFNILNNITVEKSIEDKKLSFQTTNCLGVISNEIIINTIKYAFDPNQKGSINYRLSFQENQGCLVIGDNGRGIPSETASHGFGTTLIKMMVKQIKGDVEINNSNGTEYKICFPFEENFT